VGFCNRVAANAQHTGLACAEVKATAFFADEQVRRFTAFMPETYHVPALVLTALLLPAFGYLYLRFRDTRTLLWFLGFLFVIFRMVQRYNLLPWDTAGAAHPWWIAASQASILLSSVLFLASLSLQRLRLGSFRVLYVIPFTIPLVIYSVVYDGIYRGVSPQGPIFFVFPALLAISLLVACFWASVEPSTPIWLGLPVCLVIGTVGLWVCFAKGGEWPLLFVESAVHLLTAALLISVYRRYSPGVFLSGLGFVAWSLFTIDLLPMVHAYPVFDINLGRVVVMGKVVAALGMILLALEDQLAVNQAAQLRERRARKEIEAYTALNLSRRRVEDFDSQGDELCQTVVEHSRFSQAVLVFQSAGRYRLVGAAGLDAATAMALERLVARIPVGEFLEPGSSPSVVDHSQTVHLDLTPWLLPGDDLKRLNFTAALAVPMAGRADRPHAEGALLLAGVRKLSGNLPGPFRNQLRDDDLMPVEMLTARLQAARSQTTMLEKLIDSEKFAGLGQLAANVTQQLNNPLTVILGYASLLDETSSLNAHDRKGVDAILTEARRMRTTLESLTRISRHHSDQLAAVSVPELLADMEELHRPEFVQRSIDFRLSIAPSLPRVLCHAQQLRHAVLHCLQFAIEAVDSPGLVLAQSAPETKTIRLEATSEGNLVQILVAHSGPGFLHPDRAFDPYATSQLNGDTVGLGLSLCATIVRDHNGRASAVNFEPRGAAIILELQAA
jgi:signal transduction histidine kinase